MDHILHTIKRLIPKKILNFIRPAYHKFLAKAAAFWYGYPSEKMIVIGVTGTNGKSTTTELIARVLEYANQHKCESACAGRHESTRKNLLPNILFSANDLRKERAKPLPDPPFKGEGACKVGFTSTVKFKVGDKEWLNDKKMTMLGRFALQKLLRDMVKAGCRYAVIETSSEGIKQARHKGINYDYLVFTNLTPEHIESHGSFEKYKEAKLSLFKHLESSKRKSIKKVFSERTEKKLEIGNWKLEREQKLENRNCLPAQAGKLEIPKVIIVNGDDKYANEFLNFKVDEKVVYGAGKPHPTSPCKGEESLILAENVRMDKIGIYFDVHCEKSGLTPFENQTHASLDGVKFQLKMLGKFNVYNALPAIIIGRYERMEMEKIKDALEKVEGIPGRIEFIDEGQDFKVLIDYAPELESMRKLYETVEMLQCNVSTTVRTGKIIHVLGSCGGGRDKTKRRILGRIAAENADIVIVTNEDPYDDDPMGIINEVARGAEDSSKFKVQMPALRDSKSSKFRLFKILDRREAIRKALELAEKNDLVLITGKGAEQAICIAGGKKIPWDDRKVVREEIFRINPASSAGQELKAGK